MINIDNYNYHYYHDISTITNIFAVIIINTNYPLLKFIIFHYRFLNLYIYRKVSLYTEIQLQIKMYICLLKAKQ